jgi:hypothetical protein
MSTRSVQDALDKNFSLSITYLPTNDIVSFSAYLTKFNDSFQQSWSDEQVYGRMDPIYLYKNTRRKISISMDVPSESEEDAKLNFRKISKLIRFCYPVYEKAKQTEAQYANTSTDIATSVAKTSPPSFTGNALLLSTPPLVGVRFANFIRSSGTGKLVCKLDGVTYDTDTESGYFSSNGNLYTMFYKVDLNLDVIHTEPLGWEKGDDGRITTRTKNFPYGV